MSEEVKVVEVPSTGFMRIQTVLKIIPVSKTTWWEGVKSGRFPSPVKLTPRTTAWRCEEILAYIKSIGE